MITITRKLAIKITVESVKNGKVPKNVRTDIFYPVVGYVTGKQQREDEIDYEDLKAFIIINEAHILGYVYPSLCEVHYEAEK